MTVDGRRSERAKPVEPLQVVRLQGTGSSVVRDEVVGEEPLEIRVEGPGWAAVTVGVTMRTPGHDFELATGFLFSEGHLRGRDAVATVRYCEAVQGEQQRYNVVTVTSRSPVPVQSRRLSTTITSSCGVCGTTSLDELLARCSPPSPTTVIGAPVLYGLPERLRAEQRIFDRTGGLHAAGLFDCETGTPIAVREDIGRHNAVDKLLGWGALGGRLPLSHCALVVSGRVSFEIVQKAAIAGIPVLAAVSAPSSLAVETARRLRMTLAAFVREDRANVYSAPQRIVLAPEGTLEGREEPAHR